MSSHLDERNLHGYRIMLRIRSAEQAMVDHYKSHRVFSFVHFSIGQEASAAAICMWLHRTDRVFGNHRSHGHFLAKGGGMAPMFSEMLGKATGAARGYGGSMHLIDRHVGFSGSTPILASAAPLAAGSSLEQQLSGSRDITAVFVGDGASEEGQFYETLNFAAVRSLPLLVIVEDNMYSVNTPRSVRRHETFSLNRLAESLGVECVSLDGTDFLEASRAARTAVARVREDRVPIVVHASVFRYMTHSAPLTDDAAPYREEDLGSVRNDLDPILRLRKYLESCGFAPQLDQIDESVAQEVAAALDSAISAPQPVAREVNEHVFVQ